MTIPVTLRIVAVGETLFGDLPGRLTFSFKTSGPGPAAQPLLIRNAGSGSLAWTASASTADGGNWLVPSASSGTAPSTLDISINKVQLPGGGSTAGYYSGQIELVGAGKTVTIPVMVSVGPDVYQQVNPLQFTKVFGGPNPLPQTISINTTGLGRRPFISRATARGDSWFRLADCGVSPCLTPFGVNVIVEPAITLAAGTYTGQITLSGPRDGALYFEMNIPVTLTIVPPGSTVLDDIVGQLSFSFKTGGVVPGATEVPIRSQGTVAAGWTLVSTTADGAPWLTTSMTSGSTPSLLNVGISGASLPGGGLQAGVFVGQIVVQHSEGNVTIPVVVRVGDEVLGQIAPIRFVKLLNGPDPLPQVVTVPTTGADTPFFRLVISTGRGGNWLSTSDCTNSCRAPGSFKLKVDAAALTAGTYFGQVIVRLGSTPEKVIPVTLTVLPADTPSFDALPGGMSFFMKTSAATAPAPQDIDIRNAGSGTLAWTLTHSTSDGGSWLSVSSTSGSAPATVRVSVNPSALPFGGLLEGKYSGELVLRSGDLRVTVPVLAVVSDNTLRQLSALHFVKPFGAANPLSQILPFESTGTNLSVGYIVTTASGGGWLKFFGCCTTPANPDVRVEPDPALPPGVYRGQIQLTGHAILDPFVMTIPVTMTITPAGAPAFDDLQGHIAFTKTVGAGNPAPWQLEIRNAGAGTLDWTVETSTSDGGAWLQSSVPGGSTNAGSASMLSISATTAALPDSGFLAGRYVGRVILKSAAGNLTIPVSYALGNSEFLQPAPLRFTRTFGGTAPASQTIPVALTGPPNLQYSPVYETAKGGSWLQALRCSSICMTPDTLTVEPAFFSTTPPGVYTGQILLRNGGTSYTRVMAVPVTLEVTGAPCSFTLNPASVSLPASGVVAASLSLTASASPCTWTAASNASWITLPSAASGAGNATVSYTVAPNTTSAPRTGTITIAGQTFTINQQGACSYSIAPTSATLVAGGGAGSVAVTTTAGCAWTASSNAAWITLTSGASGSGPGTGNYTVAGNTGVQRTGNITIAGQTFTVTQNAPIIGPVVSPLPASPSSGSGLTQTFTYTYTNANGFADFSVLNILINDAIDGRNACYLAYIRSIDTLVLVNDAGDAGGPFVGSLVLPTSASIANSQCTVNGAGSSVTTSGNNLTLVLNMSFSNAFRGRRVTYLAARGNAGDNSGWHPLGIWTVPGSPTVLPVTASTPARAESSTVNLSTTFTDNAGATDFSVLNVLVNGAIDGRNACYIAYVRSINTVVLVNDAGEAAGPFVGSQTLPGSGSISNSQCTINASLSSVIATGNTLTLNLHLTFSGAFPGDQIVYAAARDEAGNNSGWQAVGTVTVP